MSQYDYFYLSKAEKKYFISLFNERCTERNEIMYPDFKEIVYGYKRFEEATTRVSLDKIKKKNSILSLNEADWQINLDDFLNFIENIAMDHEKIINEKDPELKNLFNLLCEDESTMKLKRLIDIIVTFDLPIIIKDFFSPLGKKDLNPNDELNFTDFCSLFKAKNSNTEVFMRTFNGSINISDTANSTMANFNKNLFPIEVKKNDKLY